MEDLQNVRRQARCGNEGGERKSALGSWRMTASLPQHRWCSARPCGRSWGARIARHRRVCRSIAPTPATHHPGGASSRDRTGTPLSRHGILSPGCLPISPSRHAACHSSRSRCAVGRRQPGNPVWTRWPQHLQMRAVPMTANAPGENEDRRRAGLCSGSNMRQRAERRRRKAKKSPKALFAMCWSGKTGSNRRPIPWQGIALPTELFPQKPA